MRAGHTQCQVWRASSLFFGENTQGGPPGMIPEGLDSWSGATPFLSPYCEIKSTSEMMTPQAEGHQGLSAGNLSVEHPARHSEGTELCVDQAWDQEA